MLQEVLIEAIKHYDFTILWGHRGMEEQNKAFNEGNSKLRWPLSKHNANPSKAFDVVPYPKLFESSTEEFYLMATFILAAASKVGVPIKWGGHWKTFKDLAHFELIE